MIQVLQLLLYLQRWLIKSLLKLDWYINDNHRLEYVYSFSDDNAVRPYNYDIRFQFSLIIIILLQLKKIHMLTMEIYQIIYMFKLNTLRLNGLTIKTALGGEDFPAC